MNLDILHYHLQPGGVTRIIQSQVKALEGAASVDGMKLLVGSVPQAGAFLSTEVIVEPSLEYLPESWTAGKYRSEAAHIPEILSSHIDEADVVHAHNPTLGKNPLLTYALSEMVRRGQRLFYHCHDFAEERPDRIGFLSRVLGEYLGCDPASAMYPDSPSCLFGVLNSRDLGFLRSRGIPKNRVYLLPNPVWFSPEELSLNPRECRRKICSRFALPPEREIMLYPVRAIRRKNIGELILLSRLFAGRSSWLITMAPRNPAEQEEYGRWKAFAERIRAPVVFEAGARLPFPVLMRGADRIVTTSRREGFGMSYLESWLFGKPVAGRNIPYVTRDFIEEGLVLDRLYNRLPMGSPEEDFGDLEPSEQRKRILRLEDLGSRVPGFAAEIEEVFFGDISPVTVSHNRKIVRERYGLEGYGSRLDRIYQRMSRRA